MKKPKLSNDLNEDLKKHSRNDRKRRIITNTVWILLAVFFIILAKMYFFKGNINVSGQVQKSPSQKIENQPQIKNETSTTVTTKAPVAQPAPTTTTTTPISAQSQGYTSYVVKNGDTLSQIANANGMTSKQLADYNGMSDADSLQPGQTIKIPK